MGRILIWIAVGLAAGGGIGWLVSAFGEGLTIGIAIVIAIGVAYGLSHQRR